MAWLFSAFASHSSFTSPFAAFVGENYTDPVARVVLSLAIILTAAKLCSHVAERLGQPAVLGELVAGIVLGNLWIVHFRQLDYLKTDPFIDLLAGIGVILLLFQVGLESTVKQMLQVGLSSFLVASLGVAGPFALGWGVGAWLMPEAGPYVHAFLGAMLTATSVGITARVLRDIGESRSPEARIILGAAVIDDVQGLVILAVVTGSIATAGQEGGLSYSTIAYILAKATAFLVGALLLGIYLSPRLFHLASKLQTTGVLLSVGLSFGFLFAFLANAIGLAPIVGAFAAGLILEELHYRDFVGRGEHNLEELVAPIVSFLAPVFFVLMGIRTDLHAFAKPGVLWLALVLTAAALLGKQLGCFGVLRKGASRLCVGLGMVPRGEVGLIFANIGLTLSVRGKRIITEEVFSAAVIMVIATTFITPPGLKWAFERKGAPERNSSSEKVK